MMAIAFFMVLTISGGNDVVAQKLNISLNAMTWGGRVALLIAPPIAFYVTYRICLGLQQHDREVLSHGVETGIIKRLPDGRFIEVHQPLSGNHLEYTGAPVPKKMNKIGALGPAVRGFFRPIEKSAPPPPAATPVSPADAPRSLEEAKPPKR
jgi:ubiquinol-cytochrome c reductase cytochrome b subunit